MLGLDALEFDGDLLPGDDVSAQVDVTKGARADLSTNAVLVTDAEILERKRKRQSVKEVNHGGDQIP